MSRHPTANAAVEKELSVLAQGIEKIVDADVLTYIGAIVDGVDDAR